MLHRLISPHSIFVGEKKEYFVHKFETDTPVCIPGMLYKVNLTDEFSGGLFQRNDRWYSIGSEDDGPPSNGHFRVCGSSVKTAAIEKEDPQNNTNNKRKEWKEKGKKPFPIGCLTLFEHTSQLNNGRIPPSSIQPLYSSAPLYLSHRKCVAYSEGGPHRLSFFRCLLWRILSRFRPRPSDDHPVCACWADTHLARDRPPFFPSGFNEKREGEPSTSQSILFFFSFISFAGPFLCSLGQYHDIWRWNKYTHWPCRARTLGSTYKVKNKSTRCTWRERRKKKLIFCSAPTQ